MSDDRPQPMPTENDWDAEPEGQEELDEAVYLEEEEAYWDDEADMEDIDESMYEPPEPPLTDAGFAGQESPEDENWLRANWWRVAIIAVAALAVVALLIRDRGGSKVQPTPEPLPSATLPPLPTFTPTPPTSLEGTPPGNPLPPASSPLTTPQAPAPQPTTPPPTATSPPASGGRFSTGQTVVVTGTGKDRLAFREGPGRKYPIQRTIKDGVKLTVIGGPKEADGYTWWHLRTPKGYEGWAVEDYLKPLE